MSKVNHRNKVLPHFTGIPPILKSHWIKNSLHPTILKTSNIFSAAVISSLHVSISLSVWKMFFYSVNEYRKTYFFWKLVNPSCVSEAFSWRHFKSRQRLEPYYWYICPDSELYFRRITLLRYAICPLHSLMGNRVNCVQHNKTQTSRSLNSCSVGSRV